MDEATRELVRRRANGRCEYCGLPQEAAPFFRFHIEHIRARQHHGQDDPSNLALACPDCNAKKGPNLTTVSPDTGRVVELFNPRIHR
jgi:5-methylcytosine-specific restriction endonuclease McrA